jgi:Leucine-rich repeat (LRR) protein
LEGNQLQLAENVYRPSVFQDLKALRLLNLKKNSVQFKNAFPDDMWKHLSSLQTLKIDVTSAVHFGKGFLSLSSLTKLDVSGATGFCNLEVIRENFFENMPHLEVIDVSSCDLRSFEAGALSNQQNISVLDISYNQKLTFASFANITYDLQFSKIKVFKANKIHCSFGIGSMIKIEDIMHFRNTSLEEIYLDDNRLALVEKHVLQYLPKSLKTVSIVKNRMVIGPYLLDVTFLTGMETFDMSFQYFTHPYSDAAEVFGCQNPIRPYGNVVQIMTPKQKTEFSGTDTNLTITLPRNLTSFNLSRCSIRLDIFRIVVRPSNQVLRIDVSQNIIPSFVGPVVGFRKVKYVDLSQCFCSFITSYFFDFASSLEVLKLGSNRLGFSLKEDVNGAVFKALVNLQELDLSDNRIQDLPSKIFKNLQSIRKIKLNSNYLTEWNVNINHMMDLSEIDLSGNLLRKLSHHATRSFSKILKRNKSFKILLANNSFVCTCDSVPFIKWSTKHRRHISDFHHMQCKLDNGTTVGFQDIESVLQFLGIQCRDFKLVIVISTSVIIVFVIGMVAGLIYRYRWRLRYLFYMTRNKFRLYSPILQDTYMFDAFISYAEEDGDFAIHESISQLEDARGLKLCLSNRDFRPGTEIAANITEAISKSRRTIMVLSNHFLNSYWCMFEFNMARMESIYTRNGNDVMFLIMYRRVSAKTLPLSMLALVESRSYIEYPDDPRGNVVFWDKIAETCVQPEIP